MDGAHQSDGEAVLLGQRVKEAALGYGADVVGIAPTDRWDDFVPEGYRPYDLLPRAWPYSRRMAQPQSPRHGGTWPRLRQ
jgi:hypothetical protein